MKQSNATLLAFMAATALTPAYLALEFPLSIVGTFLVFGHFTAMVSCVIAVPTYAVLSKFGQVTWWSSSGCGVLMGPLPPRC